MLKKLLYNITLSLFTYIISYDPNTFNTFNKNEQINSNKDYLIAINNTHLSILQDMDIINNNFVVLETFTFDDLTIMKINHNDHDNTQFPKIESILHFEEDSRITKPFYTYNGQEYHCNYNDIKPFSTNGEQLHAPWHLSRINQRTKPVEDNYIYQVDGNDQTVYVLDTGIDTLHPEFEGRASTGYDRYKGQTIEEHGTHVAGIIGSMTYGVAKKVKLVSVRILDSNGSGSYSDIIAGLEWLYNNNRSITKSRIINMSLGGPVSRTFDQVLRKLYDKGYILVSAAGNERDDACNSSPAHNDFSITVGSTNVYDAFSYFSNYGKCVNVLAPGEDILSTIPKNGKTFMSGTSMASPVVAGVVTLILHKYGDKITNNNVLDMLKSTFTHDMINNIYGNTPNLLAYSFN